MKRNLKFVTFLVMAVLVCTGTLALTAARAERSESAGSNRTVSDPSDSSPVAMNQGGKTYRQDVAKVLKRHDSVELDPQRVSEQVRLTGRLSIPTADGTFALSLAPHDMRAANYRAEVTLDGGEVLSMERGPVRTYKGTVEGMKGAQARFTIDENMVEGLIITSSELFFVEPAKRYSASASTKDFIVYKASDLIQSSFGECGTLAEKVGAEAARVQSKVSTALGPGTEEMFSPPRTIDLATEADFEYFTFFGSAAAANNEIISIMNQVEGIYNTQFGLQFTIVFQNVWAVAGDPYNSTDSSAVLTEFANQWNSTRQAVTRDLAHLWTGKNLDANVVGIAFRPGMECPFAQSGYGVTQRSSGSARFLITAHEIGHNFNATHTNDPPPGQPGCENRIMETTLGSGTLPEFCPFSVNQIETHANAEAGCLDQAINPACTYTLSSLSQSFAVGGGPGSVNVTTVGTSCVWGAGSTVDWITINSGSSNTNNGVVTFTVSPNSGFGRSGIIRIAEQDFRVNQAGASGCVAQPIFGGQTINGALSISDCPSSQRAPSFADQYSFSASAGTQVRIEMTSTATPTLDTYLYLIGPTGAVVTENDDIDFDTGNINSRIPLNGFFTLPATGTYVIEATSFDTNETGTYTLLLTSTTPVQFSASTASATETLNATTKVDLTVTRSGDTTAAASVNYASSDGTASERSDYLAALGTVRFQANETTKTVPVFIVDDAFGEGPQSFNVTLSNPVGCVLSGPATITVTINSNEAVTGSNPVSDPTFSTDFFVREHYVDFFNREADAPGLGFWKNQIDSCPDQACREIRRINVSAAFFLSIEFQETGYLVYKAYQAAFNSGEQLALRDFLPDLQEIGRGFAFGQPGADALLEANKQNFFLAFVQRPAFLAPGAYPTTLTAAQFVDKLNGNTFDPLNPGAGALTPGDRNTLIAQLSPDPTSPALRAQVLRSVSENGLFTQRQFNKAFVLMQYFGYLRRNPNAAPDTDFAGYNFWLSKLNQFNGNFVNAEMVKAFITSTEYIQRFGP
ncbi:MAG: M12 family metallo-peptidase [Pyrinomonadaceae bacterium]|nr:M12 family metallo-peptidase [Pyrinomonadaceae bacterium]